MAKLSLINRDEKRRALVKKYAKKREALDRDHQQHEGVGRGSLRRAAQAAAAAAQRESRPACATAVR